MKKQEGRKEERERKEGEGKEKGTEFIWRELTLTRFN